MREGGGEGGYLELWLHAQESVADDDEDAVVARDEQARVFSEHLMKGRGKAGR